MAMTLLGISGSLTKGGSTRTAIDCALRAAQQRSPDSPMTTLLRRTVPTALPLGMPLPPKSRLLKVP